MVAKRKIKKSGVDFDALRNSIRESREILKEHREKRLQIARQYAGHHYPGGTQGETTNKPVPLPIIEKMVDTLSYQLAARLPRFNVRAQVPTLNLKAENLGLSLNRLSSEIGLGETLGAAVWDALVGPIGIIKSGIGPGKEVEMFGFTHDIGQPFADVVDFDDFVFDTLAKRFDQVEYVGDRVRLPLSRALASGLYNKADLRKYAFDHIDLRNEQGDERTESIGFSDHRNSSLRSEYSLQVELWEIWIPDKGVIVTLPVDRSGTVSNKPIRIHEWKGPERGPYRILKFRNISNQILAPSPAMSILPLHLHINEVYAKLMKQMSRMKRVLAVPYGSQEEANKLARTQDGQAFSVNSEREMPQEITLDGADGPLMNALIQELAMQDDFAGSLSLLTGANPNADTLGQTQILQSNASQRIQDWQRRVYTFTQEIAKDLMFWIVTNPFITEGLTKPIPGESEPVYEEFRPIDTEADWQDFNFEVVPGSLQPKSPQSINNELLALLNQVFIPLMPLLQQSGRTIDLDKLVHQIATNANLPELEQIVVDLEPDSQRAEVGQEPMKAPTTTRHNIRTNQSSGPQGLANQLASIAGGSPDLASTNQNTTPGA